MIAIAAAALLFFAVGFTLLATQVWDAANPEPAVRQEPRDNALILFDPPGAPGPTRGLARLATVETAAGTSAAVTDARNIWWVREDRRLPDGLTVTRIATDPPGVTVTAEDGSRHEIAAWCGGFSLPFHTLPAPGAAAP